VFPFLWAGLSGGVAVSVYRPASKLVALGTPRIVPRRGAQLIPISAVRLVRRRHP